MTTHVQLHDRLDYQSVAPLMAELKTITDDELVIDASNIRHMGTLPLQVILATIKMRDAEGKTTRLCNASDSCVDILGLFGFSPETLTQPEAWT
ncbi:STAS domain-containing protein [Celeribacter neptunius]|uniref:Anti-anti-sigma regulatory factor (Antagonist of anti-sigma factor) n=1 Tax=Celeribacter neptunius TaxID=588602 RepID=A0A1I3LRR3_9RHOB|nr:STAS domain-containing protein [Celeribacter neptunius]SFI87220.1 Anti-anti-sigma regulatory factor (antagonist of anti-sigma factor) [Celeribacter neptunius]